MKRIEELLQKGLELGPLLMESEEYDLIAWGYADPEDMEVRVVHGLERDHDQQELVESFLLIERLDLSHRPFLLKLFQAWKGGPGYASLQRVGASLRAEGYGEDRIYKEMGLFLAQHFSLSDLTRQIIRGFIRDTRSDQVVVATRGKALPAKAPAHFEGGTLAYLEHMYEVQQDPLLQSPYMIPSVEVLVAAPAIEGGQLLSQLLFMEGEPVSCRQIRDTLNFLDLFGDPL